MLEAALTTLSVLHVKRLSVFNPRLTPHLLDWARRPHRVLSTILIGVNLAQVEVSGLAAALADPLRHWWPAWLVTSLVWGGMSLLTFLGGDVVPKIIGRAYCERVAEWALPTLSRASVLSVVVWGPMSWVLHLWGASINEAPLQRLTSATLDDVRQALTHSESSGQLPGALREMIERVLALPPRRVGEIALPLAAVDRLQAEVLDESSQPVYLLMERAAETGRSRLPVVRGGKVAGYVNLMDLLRAGPLAGDQKWSVFLKPVLKVLPSATVTEVLELFRSTGESAAAVEVEGVWRGWVTQEDVLEEIVGEILDEYDLGRGSQP